MITSTFRFSAHIPPGVAVVTNNDVVIYMGPIRDLAAKMNDLPAGSLIHVSIKNYIEISKAAQKADPNAPSIEDLNKEFAGKHYHPTNGWTFIVCYFEKDKWIWARTAVPRSDLQEYPTAEAAYLAAIGE